MVCLVDDCERERSYRYFGSSRDIFFLTLFGSIIDLPEDEQIENTVNVNKRQLLPVLYNVLLL